MASNLNFVGKDRQIDGVQLFLGKIYEMKQNQTWRVPGDMAGTPAAYGDESLENGEFGRFDPGESTILLQDMAARPHRLAAETAVVNGLVELVSPLDYHDFAVIALDRQPKFVRVFDWCDAVLAAGASGLARDGQKILLPRWVAISHVPIWRQPSSQRRHILRGPCGTRPEFPLTGTDNETRDRFR